MTGTKPRPAAGISAPVLLVVIVAVLGGAATGGLSQTIGLGSAAVALALVHGLGSLASP